MTATDDTAERSTVQAHDLGAVVEDAATRDRDRRVIRLMIAAAFVVILNETIMGIAISDLMRELGVDARAAQWLTTAFMLTMAVVIPVSGFLLRRFTTRQVFIAAMALFSAGTLAAALAPGFGVLVAARIVQAMGTAIMMPLLMTTIMTLVAPRDRGRMMGNVSIVISVAPAIGPTIAGVILDTLGWRWMFIVVLPIALVMLLLGLRRVENVSEPSRVPVDALSILLSAVGFGGLVYGLSGIGGDHGADAGTVVWAPLVVGVLALTVFVLRQGRLQREDRALLDLRTFRSPTFSVSIGIMVVSMAALFGALILLPMYLLQALLLEPFTVGLLMLPGGLVMGLMAPMVGRLFDRFGPRPLLVPGAVLASAALWLFSTASLDTSTAFILGVHVLLSVGLALMFTPLFTSSMGAVPPALYSHASAIVGTVQQVAGAAGTAVFVTVMATQQTTLLAGGSTFESAVSGGVRLAFAAAAAVFTVTVVAAFFVRRDPQTGPHRSH